MILSRLFGRTARPDTADLPKALQRVVAVALERVPRKVRRILIWIEVAPGFGGFDLFYASPDSDQVIAHAMGHEITSGVVEELTALYELVRDEDARRVVIDIFDNAVTVSVREGFRLHGERSDDVQRVFGSRPVDYSQY